MCAANRRDLQQEKDLYLYFSNIIESELELTWSPQREIAELVVEC